MRTRHILTLVALLAGLGAGWLSLEASPSVAAPTGQTVSATAPAVAGQAASPWASNPFLSGYIVDKPGRISVQATGLGGTADAAQASLQDYIAGPLVHRGTADYFRQLQTEVTAGAGLRENTEAIRQHLLSILPRNEADKLFALYQQFLDFELSVGEKTRGWTMPENPAQSLALIKQMQKLQQQHFGEENADLLYGGELKGMEYTARRAGILNNQQTSGKEKEAQLARLGSDMFGAEAAKLDQHKSPYNLFEDKLLIYKTEIETLPPLERDRLIQSFRDKYLPPQAKSS